MGTSMILVFCWLVSTLKALWGLRCIDIFHQLMSSPRPSKMDVFHSLLNALIQVFTLFSWASSPSIFLFYVFSLGFVSSFTVSFDLQIWWEVCHRKNNKEVETWELPSTPLHFLFWKWLIIFCLHILYSAAILCLNVRYGIFKSE